MVYYNYHYFLQVQSGIWCGLQEILRMEEDSFVDPCSADPDSSARGASVLSRVCAQDDSGTFLYCPTGTTFLELVIFSPFPPMNMFRLLYM